MRMGRANRREFIAAVCGAVLGPAAARSETGTARIAILMDFRAGDQVADARLANFFEVLESLGWTRGRNLQAEIRWTEGDTARIRQAVPELVALAPDLIFATTTPAVRPVTRAAGNIPVVFASIVDPVGGGLVASMSRPGGNATGFVDFEYALAAKWLEFLREIAPSLTRAAVLRDATVTTGVGLFAAIQTVGPIDLELSVIDPGDPAEMERQIAAFASEPNGGLIVTPSQFAGNHPGLIAASAARNKLPAIYPFRYFVDAGGLVSYGPTLYDEYRGAAGYVDRILRGEKPANLPVQAPTKHELVVNLKAAKALGLSVPQSLIARADEVIE